VVVMSRNRRDELLTTLPRHEAPVRAALPEVTVLPLARNLGAYARTMGVRHAGTEFVAFADDDSWWAPGDLARAVEVLRAHPCLAVLNARILVGPEERLDPACAAMATSPLPREDLPGPALLGFVACGAMVRTRAFLAAGGFDPVVRFPGEEERLALDLAAAGWGMAYVDSLVVHHHPSPRRHAPQERRTAVWRSRLLTAVMRRPLPEVARLLAEACRTGAPERRAVLRALPDLPAALRRRRPVPARVREKLRALDRSAA
jgi:GT2 family glycosyltransferase